MIYFDKQTQGLAHQAIGILVNIRHVKITIDSSFCIITLFGKSSVITLYKMYLTVNQYNIAAWQIQSYYPQSYPQCLSLIKHRLKQKLSEIN